MDHYIEFIRYTKEKIRGFAHIRTNNSGIEEWRAVVDTGEYAPKERTINGQVELIRPLKKSNKTYRIFIKNDKIIGHKILKQKSIHKDFKGKKYDK